MKELDYKELGYNVSMKEPKSWKLIWTRKDSKGDSIVTYQEFDTFTEAAFVRDNECVKNPQNYSVRIKCGSWYNSIRYSMMHTDELLSKHS